MKHKDKIIHMPQVKKSFQQIETKSKQLLAQGNVTEALLIIEQLIENHYVTNELYENHLACLAVLERWEEVENFSEQYLQHTEKEYYSKIMTFYLTSLFQLEQYQLVIDTINQETETQKSPKQFERKWEALYKLAEQKITEQTDKILNELQIAVATNDQKKQWITFQQWKKMSASPPTLFIHLLALEQVHPIVKTYMLESLISHHVDEKFQIVKQDKQITLSINELYLRTKHPAYVRVHEEIDQNAQQNPTIAAFMKELFERFVDVYYPFFYPEEDEPLFVQALASIATSHLTSEALQTSQNNDETLLHYIEQIIESNKLYFQLSFA